MGLDNIELNIKICSRLYKNSLVTNPTISESDKTELKAIEYQGGNKKNILFIISKKQSQATTAEEITLFNSICKACSLTMDDIALVNFQPAVADYSILRNHFKFKFLLAFGVTPSDIGLTEDFENFNVSRKNNEMLLFAPQLDEFFNNKAFKTSLWKGMQQLFF